MVENIRLGGKDRIETLLFSLEIRYENLDRYVGKLRTATDMNGVVSNYEYNEALDRPTKFTRAISRWR